MSEPRKQHYVPQVYLRSFAYGKDKNPKIYVLSKSKQKIYPANVSDSAAERDFYTIDSIEDKYVWERHYATCIEPILGELISKLRQRCETVLIQNHAVIMSRDEKFKFALSMVFQFLRGKQTREYEQNLYDRLLPGVTDQTRTRFGPLSPEQEQLLQSFADEKRYFKEIAMQAIFRKESIEKMVGLIMQRTFVVYKINGGQELVTSDNPVVFIDLNTLDATPFKNGMANTTTLIYYPISPNLLLAAYHPNLYLGLLDNYDCQIEILDGVTEHRFISTHNKKQKEQCYNYLYAHSKEVLDNLI